MITPIGCRLVRSDLDVGVRGTRAVGEGGTPLLLYYYSLMLNTVVNTHTHTAFGVDCTSTTTVLTYEFTYLLTYSQNYRQCPVVYRLLSSRF